MIGKPDFGKVAVLMGGWSAEREISLKSGVAVRDALLGLGIDAHGVDVRPGDLQSLIDGRFDCAFVVLHGRGGEDGVIQSVLEFLQIPYTGSDVPASALCMNKWLTKKVWTGSGMPTPPAVVLDEDFEAEEVTRTLGWPCIVKPALEGSSIGMSKAQTPQELDAAWKQARSCGGAVFAESWIEGSEYTVAILHGEALPAIRLETPRTFYDFEAKYRAASTRYHIPCGLDAIQEARLQELAVRAFSATGASGWGRVDVMTDREGRFWPIEVNTVPGMTDHSLVPMAAAARGIDFPQLVLRILETCRVRSRNGERHA